MTEYRWSLILDFYDVPFSLSSQKQNCHTAINILDWNQQNQTNNKNSYTYSKDEYNNIKQKFNTIANRAAKDQYHIQIKYIHKYSESVP